MDFIYLWNADMSFFYEKRTRLFPCVTIKILKIKGESYEYMQPMPQGM